MNTNSNDSFIEKKLNSIIAAGKALELLEEIAIAEKTERDTKKDIKKGGFVIEGGRRQSIIEKIRSIDPSFAESLKSAENKDKFIELIKARIADIDRELSLVRKQIKKISPKEEKTLNQSERVLAKFWKIYEEMLSIQKNTVDNLELNKKYEFELVSAMKESKLGEKIDYFIKEADKSVKRSRENIMLLEKMINLMEEMEKIKPDIANMEERMISEAEETEGIIEMILSKLGFKRKQLNIERGLEGIR
ncbi:MAG: hypothetical protein AABW88_03715 [Nanoarchaeota archaeon]